MQLEDSEELRQIIRNVIREELTFDTETDSRYNGGMVDGGSMYTNYTTVTVKLNGEYMAYFDL